jgi:hypothetical protein
MKIIKSLSIIGLLGIVISVAHSADKKLQAGPKGGRLLEMDTPRAEFFVEKDRTVLLTFYDASLKQFRD